MSDGEGFLAIIVITAIYYLPAIAARLLKHRQAAAIFVLNTFMGWTVVGWVAALVWAFIVPTEQQRN